MGSVLTATVPENGWPGPSFIRKHPGAAQRGRYRLHMAARSRPANLGGFIFGSVMTSTVLAFTVYLAASGQPDNDVRGLPYFVSGPLATVLFGATAVICWRDPKSKPGRRD